MNHNANITVKIAQVTKQPANATMDVEIVSTSMVVTVLTWKVTTMVAMVTPQQQTAMYGEGSKTPFIILIKEEIT